MTNVQKAASPSPTTPAFHSDDLEPLAEYRTISSLAIVGLLFGLAAPLCFIMPLLMAIPLVGAAISIVALRQIAASEGALAGRWAAAAGLALCVASAAAAISHSQVTRYLHSQQAEAFAREWIALLLAGNADEAFGLTVEGARPAPPPEPGEPVPSETPREHFGHHPLVAALAAAGPDSTIHFDGTTSYESLRTGQLYVGQRFTITPPTSAATDEAAKSEPIEAVLTLQRFRSSSQRAARWLVLSHQAPGLATADAHAH